MNKREVREWDRILEDRAEVRTSTGKHLGHVVGRRGRWLTCQCGAKSYDHPPVREGWSGLLRAE